jgi:hypothetical protein
VQVGKKNKPGRVGNREGRRSWSRSPEAQLAGRNWSGVLRHSRVTIDKDNVLYISVKPEERIWSVSTTKK